MAASGLTVTVGLPFTPVNTARTTMITKSIILCCKTQMLKGGKNTSWKERRQENDSPVSVELCKGGVRGGGEAERRGCPDPAVFLAPSVYFLFVLTKHTAPLVSASDCMQLT